MKIRCCLLLAACVACAPEAFARKWTDATMAHTIEAQFVDCVYGTVRLQRADNSIITIPLRMLCEADHQFIRAYYSVTPASAAAALPPWAAESKIPAGSTGGASLSGETSHPQTSTFVLGEPVQLTFGATDLAVRRTRVKLQWAVVNENGKLLHLAEIPIEPEANGTWKTMVDAPHGRLGFYRVYARLSNGVQLAKLGSRGAGYLTYCIVPDPAARRVFSAAETFFGMQGGFNPKVNIIPYLGIRWLLGPYSWKDMEPNRPGEFVEQRVAAKREGRQFPPDPDSAEWTVGGQRWRTYNIPTMLSPPRWAVVPGTMSAGTGTLNPAGEKEWKDYCLAVGKANAEDHPDRAERLYQITWEPDIGFTGTDEDLLRMYQIAYPALHEADPKARVLGPTAHLNVQWQRNLLRKGLGRYLDGWTIHPSGFEGAALIEMVRALKVSIRQYIGRDLPVYGTEQNSSTNENPGKELDQACGLLRGNLIMLGEDFRLNIAFYIADGSGEPGYGYFYNLNPKIESGTDKIGPKPIAPAYAAQSFLLEGYHSAGPIDGLGETVGGYAYQRGDDVVLALWDYGGRPRHVSLPTGASQVDVYDWMGNKNTALTPNLTLSLTLGPEPVYVTGISAQFWDSRPKKYSKQKTSQLVRAPGTDSRAVHQMIPWTRYDADRQANLAADTASMPVAAVAATPPVPASAAQASPRTQEPPADDDRWTPWQDLFDGRSLDDWTPSGSARVENGSLILENGRFAGVATARSVPKIGYEVALEAMRLTGKDFGSLVFPVHEMHCGLTVGGFSGDVVGFGNVNGILPGGPQSPVDRRIALEANRWYTVRLRVTEERITAWLDNHFVIALNPRGCQFEAPFPQLRPLGIFAWGGKAAIRSVRLRQLKSPSAGTPENVAGPTIENWVKTVAAMPAEEQLKAVSQKLTELNPGFDGRMTGYDGKGAPMILAGAVTQLGFVAGDVTDISPLRALAGLKALSCSAGPSGSALTDLSPLAGMQLTMLNCSGLLLSDLSPLRGMPLTYLECGYTRLSDLSPLRGMRLTYLGLSRTRVSDLSPLEGMPLTKLSCNSCGKISDLSPLRGMPLQELDLDGAHVADLSALRGMPLKRLLLNGTLVDDVSPLQACKDIKYLDLRGSHVDRADVPALWRAVPNCKIEWPAPAKRGSPR